MSQEGHTKYSTILYSAYYVLHTVDYMERPFLPRSVETHEAISYTQVSVQ